MKKMGYLCLILFCLTLKTAFAECNIDLRTQAANVKANYVISEVVLDQDGNEVTDISLEDAKKDIEEHQIAENLNTSKYVINEVVLLKVYNLTDKIYITVTENKTGSVETYHYENSNNGEITIRVPDVEMIREYKVRVYSNDASCLGEEISSPPPVNTPKYNPFSEYEICLNQTKYYCQPYVTTDITISEDQIFAELYKDETSSQSNESQDKKMNWWSVIKMLIPFIVIIALLGSIGYIFFQKKRIKKES